MAADILTIRAATPADLPALDALYGRSYPALLKHDYAPSVMVTAVPLLARAQPVLVASGTYFVAETGGALIAAGGWTRSRPGGAGPGETGTGNVRHVVTAQDHVRRGIGRALMEHVVADAAAAGIRRLDCLSTRTAVPFYAALGFRRIGAGETVIGLAPGIEFQAVRMARALSPPP